MKLSVIITTLVAFSLLCINGFGQVFPFADSFDNNQNNWYQGDSNGAAEHIHDGKLFITSTDKGWISSIKPMIVFEKDFVLQAAIRQIDGINNNGVGLMWGYNRKTVDQNYFLVNAVGSYYIGNNTKEMGTKQAGIREWVNSTAIKPMGQVNVLKVEQKAGMLSFYINDTKVSTVPMFHWLGLEIGVLTFVRMSFEVDDLTLDQGLKINLPPNPTKGFVKENLGSNINTASDEISPSISSDGHTLYFGRENFDGNTGGISDGEDFYMATLDGTQWGKAINMGSPINTTSVNNILAVSSDNNSVLFADATHFLIRKRTATGWSDPEPIGINFVNEGSNFESTLSADGKAVLFTARSKDNLRYVDDSFLERDIFVSIQGQDGKWSSPFNLGPTINTAWDELGPFLAADGKTLYFSTTGRPGYGGMDVFVSKRLDDTWKNWSEPVNLGPEINSNGFDAYYVLPASADYAIMVSNLNGLGKADLVKVSQPKETKPDPVVLVRGKTLDAKTNAPISTDIHIENLTTRKEVGEAISDPATGNYKIILPYGVNYGFHASVPGYLSVNENLELVSINAYAELEKNLLLVAIQVGANIQLNNVFFEAGRPILKAESYPELDRLIGIMKDNPSMEIQLNGYTDNNGRETSLIILSMDRVGAVKKYMTDKGILAKRITGKGYGPANPIVKNDTDAHRQMNRRVEFKIVKK